MDTADAGVEQMRRFQRGLRPLPDDTLFHKTS